MINWLFEQYNEYSTLHITLEIVAVLSGLLSVWFAKKENIWVFPTGLVSTGIFVYLLYQWQLVGDMLINAYYFLMSIYGWWVWSQKINSTQFTPITSTTKKEGYIGLLLFVLAIVFVYFVYQFFNYWIHWVAYIDTFTTALFFVAMWLMAKKKLEHWHFWILGNLISIPLYFYKGYTFTSIQYIIFTIIAIYGLKEWNKKLKKHPINPL